MLTPTSSVKPHIRGRNRCRMMSEFKRTPLRLHSTSLAPAALV
jgi:hypothetical protein